jgi:hypothetical protein
MLRGCTFADHIRSEPALSPYPTKDTRREPMSRSTMLMFALGVTALPLVHAATAEGLPTGKRQHKPKAITKGVDKANALDAMLMTDIDPPANESEAMLIVVRSNGTTSAGVPRPKYSNITLKRGFVEAAWRFEVDGVAACNLADGVLLDAAGSPLLVQRGDSIFVPGARKARYVRTSGGVLDADGNIVAIPYDDETERPPLELMTFAAMADGFCR